MKNVSSILLSLLFLFLMTGPAASAFEEKFLNFTKVVQFPIGKGKCPPFKMTIPKEWEIKSGRAKGDRWLIVEAKSKNQIARLDYKLSNTDQKQLPEVSSKDLKLGSSEVSRYTVTTSILNESENASKADSGLITSYTFLKGKLEGLVFMTESYDKNSDPSMALEEMIKTISF